MSKCQKDTKKYIEIQKLLKKLNKQSHHFRFMQILKVYKCQKIMGSKIQMSLIQINIKNILIVAMALN